MWHEARKQEKKIRCMLVDYQRRAQRRKDYYDKIKADPTQFLQLHGRPCKIHLDPAVCIAANSSATMMPWQGNASVMIDRFDVRAHLDYIPELNLKKTAEGDLSYEERQINYERYRILVQNDFFSITEDKFLHQIHLEEKFGPVLKNTEESHSTKKKATAAIGYNYDEEDSFLNTPSSLAIKTDENIKNNSIPLLLGDGDEENDSESDIDLDLTVDVSKIETQQANELNACAHPYGMMTNDFFSFLNNDLEEAENMRIVKEQEEEKAMFSGRKSRKERRAFRERTLVGRKLSPPSYAWRKSPSYEDYRALVSSNRSRSKSSSPQNSGQITYITSFGGDEPSSSSSAVPKSSTSSSTLSKEATRRRLTSRSRSKEKERTKRLRRSRSASADYRRRSSARSRQSRSRTRSRSISKVKSKRSRSRSEHRKVSPRSSPRNISMITSSGSGFGSNSDQNTIPRYYGRNQDKSSSELSLSSGDESSKQSQSFKSKTSQVAGPSRSNASNKNTVTEKLTPQERLRRKRQVLLNKQFKADKRAEREKVLKQVQERIDRAEEMKEISIKLRRRQRMLRHNDSPRRHSSRSHSSSSDERSTSRSPFSRRSYRRDRHRGKSASDDDSADSGGRSDKRRGFRKCRDSVSHSRSRSRSRSRTRSRTRSRSRSRSPRRGKHNEERDSRRQSGRDYDRAFRSKRYCSLSEERELARSQLEGKTDSDWRDDYRARRERSPKSRHNDHAVVNEDRRERTHENDRYGNNRVRHSRRSTSRDRYSNRYDY